MDERYLHEYTLNGSQIVKETVYSAASDDEYSESYTLVYIYDETGAPIGMKYRTPSMAVDTYICYFFEKNLQGDIVSVYNSSGLKLIAYTYNAWGNFEVSYPNGYSALGGATCNPFKYRGYYYDTETGFYYLQSRYYNPQWGRFLNVDGFVSTGQGFVGYNMYAYCNNNPVMYVDYSGEAPWIVLAIVAVAVLCLSSCDDKSNQNTDEKQSSTEDNSWADEDPILSKGRHKSEEAAIESALAEIHEAAKDHDKEIGCYVYELYGGYYVSLLQSGISATDRSVIIDTSRMSKNATLVALVHSHPWHNENLLYTPSEYWDVVAFQVSSYIIDVCGCVYVLLPTSENCIDYKKLK